jgi:sugar lactone lactonase YvrE
LKANIGLFRSPCLAAVTALLVLTCSFPSRAWCAAAQSLWGTVKYGKEVIELTPTDLASSGTPTPVVLDSAALGYPVGLAFDKSENLWVTTGGNLVVEFTKSQLENLSTVSNPTPNATIGSTSFTFLAGCTFDKHGNLWLIDEGDGVHELTSAQLSAGSNSNITPNLNITSTSLDYPNFGVFDKSGNLWLSSTDNSQIVKFAKSQLKSSGAETPKVILSGSDLDEPEAIAFDSKGSLWVANYQSDTVAKFEKSQLKKSGTPTPKVTLSGSAISGPNGLALDKAGNLWFSNYGSGDVSEFTSKQLKTSGTPTPPVVLPGYLQDSFQMTFGPVF